MHDPWTLAHKIKSPFKNKSGYRNSLISIWHVDPETDGTDNSCGWFMRARHGDDKVLEEIKSEFEFNFKNNYWFDKNDDQVFSTIGTLVQMYKSATWIHFKRNRKKQVAFMRKHLFSIISFAENPFDCIGDTITNKWGSQNPEERFGGLAGIIYADILRKERKWYKHPKWHVHHWRIRFDFVTVFFRKFKNKNEPSKNVDQNLRDTA